MEINGEKEEMLFTSDALEVAKIVLMPFDFRSVFLLRQSKIEEGGNITLYNLNWWFFL